MKNKTQLKQLLLVLFIFTFSAVLAFGQNYGDVNADGSSDIIDALLAAQCYVGLTTCLSAEIGDVNCDGRRKTRLIGGINHPVIHPPCILWGAII